MNDLSRRTGITKQELARGRWLKVGALAAPFVLPAIPAAIFALLFFVFATSPPAAAVVLFLGLIFTIIAFVIGLGISAFLGYRYGNWTQVMRDRIAAIGISAEEIEWFKNELKGCEKKALKEISSRDLLLADAYRDTLASRLTASRIFKSSRKELLLMQRRQNKLKYLKAENSKKFQAEIAIDIDKISSINTEAKQMLAEAETRLQMIEAASIRGSSIADSELALKKLSARRDELPLALESAKMAEEIRQELDKELEADTVQ